MTSYITTDACPCIRATHRRPTVAGLSVASLSSFSRPQKAARELAAWGFRQTRCTCLARYPIDSWHPPSISATCP